MTAILLSQINVLHNMHVICQKFEVCHYQSFSNRAAIQILKCKLWTFQHTILLSRIVEFLQKGKIKSFPWACFHGHDLVEGQMPVLWPLESIGTPVHWEQLKKNQNQHQNNVTTDLASCNHLTLEVPHSYNLWSNAWNQSFISPLISTIVHQSVLCTRWEHLSRVLWWCTARALLLDSSCLAQILLQLKSELWLHKSLGFANWYS
jgi:hypothetical protein